MSKDYDKFIDGKGLKCPQPLLLVKLGMQKINPGEVLLLQATDPHTDLDLQVWCERFKHEIIDYKVVNEIFSFWIKK